MKQFTAFACLAALVPAAACATTSTTTTYRSVPQDDYRISVEIPLDGTEFADEQILRVNELLDERTEFDSSDFQLDEVVLVARSEGQTSDRDVAGRAELLVLEWRSGAFDIPAGSEGDWYEVRIPAPDEDPGGAWLLDVTGDVAVDFLVVVMGAAAARRRGENGLPDADGLPQRRRPPPRLPDLLDLRPDPLLRLSLLQRPLAVPLLHRRVGFPLLPCRLPSALPPVRRLPRSALRHRCLARPLSRGSQALPSRSRCPRVEAQPCRRRPTSGALRRSQAQQRAPADVPRPGRDGDGHPGTGGAS